MPSLRRGLINDDGALRPTLGPEPSAWDSEYPLTVDGISLVLSEDELPAEGFAIEHLTPQIPVDGFAPTREQYYQSS